MTLSSVPLVSGLEKFHCNVWCVCVQSGAVVRPATVPTVVPSKPVVVGGAKCGAGPRGKPAVGVAVGGTKGERKKQTREIDVPPPSSPPQKV